MKQTISIKDMQKIAKKNKGKCLSNKYINSSSELKWQCSKGHVWLAIPNNIKRGTWCPYCAGNILTIGDMRKFARKRQGKCLSRKYINHWRKLKWQCKHGHIWEATSTKVKSGQWCPYCAYDLRRLNLFELNSIAKSIGGKCLSKQYVNNRTAMQWQCGKGHIWENSAGNIKKGQWCPFCCGNIKLTIKEMKKLAKARGGRCLSNQYLNARSNLMWQCNYGHIWEATPDNVKRGTWCPLCRGKTMSNQNS